MNKQKMMKFALPALLMSALTFACLPGSVTYYGPVVPDKMMNFFDVQVDHPAAGFLPMAGVVTVLGMVLALVAAFSKKHKPFNLISWCSLGAAALTAAPYMVTQEGAFLQPNVIVTLILSVCWLLAMLQHKKDGKEETTAG